MVQFLSEKSPVITCLPWRETAKWPWITGHISANFSLYMIKIFVSFACWQNLFVICGRWCTHIEWNPPAYGWWSWASYMLKFTDRGRDETRTQIINRLTLACALFALSHITSCTVFSVAMHASFWNWVYLDQRSKLGFHVEEFCWN